MMMNRKTVAIFLLLITILIMTGCQLARVDMGETRGSDRLIGVLITREYLDLFDFERYLNDNINKISANGNITIDYDDDKYRGRLYADIVTRTYTDPETGNTFETKEFSFEGVEGFHYYCAIIPATGEEISYSASSADEAISDGHTSVHTSDWEDRISLEGTIYYSPDGTGSMTFFPNPVYQSPDGRVYAVTGMGITSYGDHTEGELYTRTLEETTTITENGKTKTAYTSIKISFGVMFPPNRIIVRQMDEDSRVISSAEYKPGELPETLEVSRNTAFILIETHKQDRDGKPVVSRSLYDKDDETLTTYYCRDDGICVKQFTSLNWNRD